MKPETVFKEGVKVISALKDALDRKGLSLPSSTDGFKGFLLLHSIKGAALVGFERGHGLAFKVLEMQSNGTPRLSAPVVVTLSKVAVGLQLGYNSVYSMLLLHSDAQVEVLAHDKEIILGKDIDIAGLPKLEGTATDSSYHKTSVKMQDSPDDVPPTVLTVSDSLMILDLSLYGGSLSVDKELMAALYGPGVNPLDVLRGKVELPESMRSAMGAITYGVKDLTTHS